MALILADARRRARGRRSRRRPTRPGGARRSVVGLLADDHACPPPTRRRPRGCPRSSWPAPCRSTTRARCWRCLPGRRPPTSCRGCAAARASSAGARALTLRGAAATDRFARGRGVVARRRGARRRARRGRPARHRARSLRVVLLRRRLGRAAPRWSCPRWSSAAAAAVAGSRRSRVGAQLPRRVDARAAGDPAGRRRDVAFADGALVRRRVGRCGRRGRRADRRRRARQGRAGPRPRRRRAERADRLALAAAPAGRALPRHAGCSRVDGLVGATPELLVRREKGLVTSRVLAGTIRRTGDDAHDLALAASLARSSQGPGGARVRRALGRRRARAALLVDERARGAVRAAPVQRHAPGHRRRRGARRRRVVAGAGRVAAPVGRGVRHARPRGRGG